MLTEDVKVHEIRGNTGLPPFEAIINTLIMVLIRGIMDDDTATEMDTFIRMVREFPVRTGLFTFSLPVFALLQLLNGVIHEGSLVYIGTFVVLAIASSVLLARYQIAVYRRRRLSRRWL